MTRGWFDLFRDNGGPALYPESNRTSGLFTVYQLIFNCFVLREINCLFIKYFQLLEMFKQSRFISFLLLFWWHFWWLCQESGHRFVYIWSTLCFSFFNIYIVWLKLFIYVPTFFSEIHYIYKCGSEFVCWREHIRYIP